MPFDILARTAGLATDAYDRLGRLFDTVNHHPSDEQLAAIRDLLDHLQRAADGKLDDALYLSAIPAGTGKSTSLAKFAESLIDNPDYAETGMLIAVNRIAEAQDMAQALTQYRDRLCVITSDPDDKRLSLGAHLTADEAQVCICTQAALKLTLRALSGAPFSAASRFHYLGKRRAVVCRDESFAFNRPVVLDGDAVAGLAKAIRRQSEEAATVLKRWTADIDDLDGLISVPDFEGLGVDFSRLEEDVGEHDDLVAQAKALAVVSGDQGYVTRQGGATALVTHYPEIPASLMPVIVTDASAKVNASYRQMALKVAVKWLVDAPKTYRNMTIRLVNTAASRSVYRDVKTTRGRDLLDMVAKYIDGVPAGEDILVIGYKGRFSVRGVDADNLRDALVKRLMKPEDASRIRYLTYGNHTATNDYRHVRHVVLLGLNFIPKAAGHAASGAALDPDLKTEHPSGDQIKDVQRGMQMDATLQAVLWGQRPDGCWRGLRRDGGRYPADQTDRPV